MEINGKLMLLLPAQSGTGKNGPWKKNDFVIETADKFPKKVCISAWNELSDQVEKIALGTELKISFDVSSREYNGRWYTDVKAWKVAAESQATGLEKSGNMSNTSTVAETEPDDVLPF